MKWGEKGGKEDRKRKNTKIEMNHESEKANEDRRRK